MENPELSYQAKARHGQATETAFIYVTTQKLTHEQLLQLNDEVGEKRSLLVCCAAFSGKPEACPNLILKKIPKAVLSRCEWGHDDYSLKVENLPTPTPEPPKPGKPGQPLLFAEAAGP